MGFIIIKKIGKLYDDFKVLCSHYNEVIHYWNNMKTLFILPNTTVYTDLNDVEKYFDKKNNDVLNVISTRINSYKRISVLYYYLFNSKTPDDLLNANFCGNFQKGVDKIKFRRIWASVAPANYVNLCNLYSLKHFRLYFM